MIKMYENYLINKNYKYKGKRQLKLFEKTFEKACEFCGTWYTANSVNSKYCNNSCAQKACEYRKKENSFPIEFKYKIYRCYMDDINDYTKTLKKCPQCNRWLPYNENFYGKGRKDRLYPTCLQCMRKINKNKRKNHKDAWSSNANSRYLVYKNSAKKRKLEFKLSKKEAIKLFNQSCHYCGYKPPDESLNGIDRVDATKGYIKNNMVSCCKRCNYMKGTVESRLKISKDEWLKQIAKIYFYQLKSKFIV